MYPASVEADPMFQEPAARDYRLRAGSSARALGRVVLDIGGTNGAVIPAGAYIAGNEIIGRTSGSSALPTPSAPTNVRIVR